MDSTQRFTEKNLSHLHSLGRRSFPSVSLGQKALGIEVSSLTAPAPTQSKRGGGMVMTILYKWNVRN